jgi:hypothetical protein
VGLDVSGIYHLRLCRASLIGELAEEMLPHTALRPAHKAVVYGRRWAVFRRAIAPSATALQYMQDPANHPTVVHALFAAHIRRQKRFDLPPLLVAEPKQIASHDPAPLKQETRESLSDSRRKKFYEFRP